MCISDRDNIVAQGNVLPVLYGEMRVGSCVVSQEISTADEGDGGQVVVQQLAVAAVNCGVIRHR